MWERKRKINSIELPNSAQTNLSWFRFCDKKKKKNLSNFSVTFLQAAIRKRNYDLSYTLQSDCCDFCYLIFSLLRQVKAAARTTIYHDGWRWHSLWRRLRTVRSDWKVSKLDTMWGWMGATDAGFTCRRKRTQNNFSIFCFFFFVS